MPTWPSTLPLPMRTGYSIEPVDPVARTDMESGPARTRRRFTAYPSMIPVKWKMTAAQYAAFRTFHTVSLDDGTQWFDIDLIVDTAAPATVQAKFVGMFKSRLVGINHEITATLEVR